MERTVDPWSGMAGRQTATQLGAIRAGLANGSVERGRRVREARGMGKAPTWGAILLPDQIDTLTPPMGRGQDAVAWEVAGPLRPRVEDGGDRWSGYGWSPPGTSEKGMIRLPSA